MKSKLKTLTLILRSVPPKLQTMIVDKLPTEVVQKLAELELSIEDELTEEDWSEFYKSWPEFAGMISEVKSEARNQEMVDMMYSERPKVKDYIAYKLKRSEERPNITNSLCKIIDQTVTR